VRVAVCDSDSFMQEMAESIATSAGHEVVGVATDIAGAVGLLEAARPDVAVIDIAMMVNSDFDLITIATGVGARVVVFSQQADVDSLHGYGAHLEIVFKPDLRELEALLGRIGDVQPSGPNQAERRRRPTRSAEGPKPTSVADAQAFFEALNNAEAGDALVGFDVPVGVEAVAEDARRRLRDTDRVLLVAPRGVRCYLPGGGEEGIRSLISRVADTPAGEEGGTVTSVIVREGEHGADAFDRLKRDGQPRPFPSSAG
jgi:hypothetical protein